jgi:hydrogen peroxide-dependent heme synthase
MSNPIVPFTLDGASVLHQMFHVRWEEWRALDQHSRQVLVDEASAWLSSRESAEGGEQSAAFAMLGHKGDLMLLHYRRDFVGLLEAQAQVRKLRISEYLECSNSYLSVVELGLYESTRKIHDELGERGLTPGSEEWDQAVTETLDRQKKAMSGRLRPEIPSARYLCFYPMDRKRGELKNWFSEDFADRQKMMHEHGMIGRKYGGIVKQIISGSIGFDDWEWGVDLFAESPLPFKQLIYEMRFDKVSAEFALFGPFYIALRIAPGGLMAFMKDDARSAVE